MRRLVLPSLLMAVLAGCGAPTPTPTPTPMTTARMFWAADTGTSIRLFAEDVQIAKTAAPGITALRYLVSHRPVDPDYTSLWPPTTRIKGVTVSGSDATVDIAPVNLNVGSEAEGIAVQQLLWTLTSAQPEIHSMRITVDEIGRAHV